MFKTLPYYVVHKTLYESHFPGRHALHCLLLLVPHKRFYSYLLAVGLGLFLATPLLELHFTEVHYSCSELVYVVLLLLAKAENVESFLQ